MRFTSNFYDYVNNMNLLFREARHLNVNINNELVIMINNLYMDYYYEKITQDNIMMNILDLMDNLLDVLQENKLHGNSFNVINSLYDCTKDFYFNN